RSPPAPTKAALARTPPPSQPNLRGPRNVPLAPADVAERRSPPAPTKVVSARKCPSPQVNLRSALLAPADAVERRRPPAPTKVVSVPRLLPAAAQDQYLCNRDSKMSRRRRPSPRVRPAALAAAEAQRNPGVRTRHVDARSNHREPWG